VATDVSASTTEDIAKEITLLGSDIDGDTLTYSITGQLGNGSISLDGDIATYTPNANFNGTDTFAYKTNDGSLDSNTSLVTVTVTAVNDPPVTTDATASTDEDTNVLIHFVDGVNIIDADTEVAQGGVTGIIVSLPANGNLYKWNGDDNTPDSTVLAVDDQLENSAGNIKAWYVPNSNYNGIDTFTYKANDGNDDSNTSTVTITVASVNDAPTTEDISTSITSGGSSTDIDLSEGTSDIDNIVNTSTLTWIIVSDASNGTTILSGNTVTYSPNSNFNETDTFTYRVNDGIEDSNISTVSIKVNGAPLANDVSVSVNENRSFSLSDPDNKAIKLNVNNSENTIQLFDRLGSIAITLDASDPNGDDLVYSLVSSATNGSVTLTDNIATYTPNQDWNGTDKFTYKANDGYLDSNIAKVVIGIVPQNDAPTASDISTSTLEDTEIQFAFQGSDIDNDSIFYSIVSSPSNGSVSISSQSSQSSSLAIYSPSTNFNGTDTFTYKASDETDDSNTATVTVTIASVNDAPTAEDVSFTVSEESKSSKNILSLSGADVDGDDLTYIITSNVTQGTVSLSDSLITYIPSIDYAGQDSLKYKVNDGVLDSNIATAIITISGESDTPSADNMYPVMDEDGGTINITLSGSDPDGGTLTYVLSTTPSNGTVTQSGTSNALTYTPNADYFGQDIFQYHVLDSSSNQSNTAKVFVQVNPIEDAPRVEDVSTEMYYTLEFGLPDTLGFALPELDVDGDEVTYYFDGDSTNFSFSANQDSLWYTNPLSSSAVEVYGIDENGTRGTPGIFTVSYYGGAKGLVAVEEWDSGSFENGVASPTGTQRDAQVSAFALPNASLGTTGYLIENRAGSIGNLTSAARDFDRFNYWTSTSEFHIELDFGQQSIAWDYNTFAPMGYVPFSAYLIDAFDGTREQLYAGYLENDGVSGWSLSTDENQLWTGPIYSANAWEPIYLYLGKEGQPYDPSKEAEYATQSLTEAGAIGWNDVANARTLKSSLDFGSVTVGYPFMTATLFTDYLGHGVLPDSTGIASGVSSAGNFTGASSILFKTEFQIYDNPDGSSNSKVKSSVQSNGAKKEYFQKKPLLEVIDK